MVNLADLETRRFESPALSLYLTLGSEHETPERFLEPVLEGLASRASDDDDLGLATALREEVRRAERELSERDAAGAVALFSCGPAGVMAIFDLPEEVPPMLIFGDQLETRPLREQLERHPGEVVRR